MLDHEHDPPKVPASDLSLLLDGNDRWYLDWLDHAEPQTRKQQG
ncbi:hypothetical protein [Streptomyces mirabilis]